MWPFLRNNIGPTVNKDRHPSIKREIFERVRLTDKPTTTTLLFGKARRRSEQSCTMSFAPITLDSAPISHIRPCIPTNPSAAVSQSKHDSVTANPIDANSMTSDVKQKTSAPLMFYESTYENN